MFNHRCKVETNPQVKELLAGKQDFPVTLKIYTEEQSTRKRLIEAMKNKHSANKRVKK